MKYKYGEMSDEQLISIKNKIRKKIYFLLIIVEKKYDYNLDKAISDVLLCLGGLNKLLDYPEEILVASYLIEEAREKKDEYQVYRKLILEAGSEIMKIGGE